MSVGGIVPKPGGTGSEPGAAWGASRASPPWANGVERRPCGECSVFGGPPVRLGRLPSGLFPSGPDRVCGDEWSRRPAGGDPFLRTLFLTQRQSLMSPISSRVLLDQLQWRYATKKFDPARKIAPADWATLEQAVTLAPSSYGLQAWKFFVVDDQSLRQKLLAASWNQSQVVDASHLVVFAVRHRPEPRDVERYVERIAEVRRTTVDAQDGLKKALLGAISRPEADVDTWLSRQVYVALGVFLASAALLGIDACPMEGFQGPQYDEILGLTAKGYSARVIATAGYRAADDRYATLPKVRYEVPQVVEHL